MIPQYHCVYVDDSLEERESSTITYNVDDSLSSRESSTI